MGKRVFSLYDVEQVLRDAGAQKIHEKAVTSLAEELENTVKELVDNAQIYATYGGRNKLINGADVRLAHMTKANRAHFAGLIAKRKRIIGNVNGAKTKLRKRAPVIDYNPKKKILY